MMYLSMSMGDLLIETIEASCRRAGGRLLNAKQIRVNINEMIGASAMGFRLLSNA